jgi:hypothetical protein
MLIKNQILICRTPPAGKDGKPMEVIRSIEDQEVSPSWPCWLQILRNE